MTTRYTLDPELAEQLLAEHPLLREVIHVESDEPGVGLRSRTKLGSRSRVSWTCC